LQSTARTYGGVKNRLSGRYYRQTNAQIQALTKQLNDALAQVQNIAVRVIDGNSDAKALKKVNEIALQQAKNLNVKG
jgi:hypothetical protein